MIQTVRTSTCICGRVRCEATGAPIFGALCYCDRCQEGGRLIEALPGAAPLPDADGGTPYLTYRDGRPLCGGRGPSGRLLAGRSRATIEQRRADLGFQPPDGIGDRRLRAPQPLGRARETSPVGDGGEHQELIEGESVDLYPAFF
jgi:hypothetical protein